MSVKSRLLLLLTAVLMLSGAVVAQVAPVATPQANAEARPVASPDSAESPGLRAELTAQREEIKSLRELVLQQAQALEQMRQRLDHAENHPPAVAAAESVAMAQTKAETVETRLAKVEEQAQKTGDTLTRQLGNITFSGDVRLRVEPTFGLLNTQPNAANPNIIGNELTSRERFLYRARFGLRGTIGKEFDWGLRFVSGSLAAPTGPNQAMTDLFSRKPFGLDQAYLGWTPHAVPGLRLQAGKFEPPWTKTEMTFDNDLMVEGFSQSYTRNFKKSRVKNVALLAWQLPFLERNSAFVRNNDGTINFERSRRDGRDLDLYGAQVRGQFALTPKVTLNLSVADQYFSGTQFISPAQFFGANVQIPITITIPATATTPAQTVTTQVIIPRDFLVTGNNLGLSFANTNTVNRDGRLSSGYNLVDIVGQLQFTHWKKWPVTLVFDYVANTQTHDVIVAGPGGANQFLPNHEGRGYWLDLLVGQTKARGDMEFNYIFTRIGKDAVLTPFNFNQLAQSSDIKAHLIRVAYAADPKVVLSFRAILSQFPNGILGPFGATPAGSLNRPNVRLQFDSIFRF